VKTFGLQEVLAGLFGHVLASVDEKSTSLVGEIIVTFLSNTSDMDFVERHNES
jgi:hypothetical protein